MGGLVVARQDYCSGWAAYPAGDVGHTRAFPHLYKLHFPQKISEKGGGG